MNDFCVVACHWNPAGWRSIRRHYQRFVHEMQWWGVPLYSVEIAYEGQEFASDESWLKLRGSARHVLWQKERLINLAVERLPPQITRVAWIDADVLFLDSDWVAKTQRALDHYPLVQLWDKWHCAGPRGEIVEVLKSVGHLASRYLARETWSPGGAWAAHRSVLPLYDRHIVGSGDAACLDGWIGADRWRCLYQYTPAMTNHFVEWAESAYAKVEGRLTTLPCDLVHLYHGSRRDRQYVDRWRPVLAAGYDPSRHVAVDEQGLLAWTDEAPQELVRFVADYFVSRREDDTDRPYQIAG